MRREIIEREEKNVGERENRGSKKKKSIELRKKIEMHMMEKFHQIYIYIKAEDVAIYLPFDMYGNVFCMTRGSLVG